MNQFDPLIVKQFAERDPTEAQVHRKAKIREAAMKFGSVICQNTVQCGDQTVSLRRLRECWWYAAAAVEKE